MPTDQRDLVAGLLGVFIDLLRALDAKGVLPREEVCAAFRDSLDAVPADERDHPRHAVLRFLLDGLAPPAPSRPAWLRGVIDGGEPDKA